MTWGPKAPKLREIELETGLTPQALIDEPKLYGYSTEVANAYNFLASRRTVGMAPNPIQLSEILAYIQVYGQPQLPVDIFMDLLSTMDSKYLEKRSGNSTS